MPASSPSMGWIAYAAVWLTFALVWTLAGFASPGIAVADTLPYGLLAMGSAGLMGIALGRLTERMPPDWRSVRFYVTHAIAFVMFCVVYSTSGLWMDLMAGRIGSGIQQLRTSLIGHVSWAEERRV